jgi:hypothetical protein
MSHLHNNPVESGEFSEPEHFLYSSALDYSGGKSLLDVQLMV